MIAGSVKVDIPWGVTEKLLKNLDRGLDDLADLIFQRSQELVPVDESTLISSGSVEREPLEKRIVYNAPYAVHVEYGTAPHIIEPKTAKALRFEVGRKARLGRGGKKNIVYAKKVRHPGTEPQPFLRPAFDEGAARAVEILGRAMRKGGP